MSKRQKQTTSNSTASRAGYVNIADILMRKLDAKAVAPEFSSSSVYGVGDVVTKESVRYVCTTAVTAAGAWNPSNWTPEDVQTAIENAGVTITMRVYDED